MDCVIIIAVINRTTPHPHPNANTLKRPGTYYHDGQHPVVGCTSAPWDLLHFQPLPGIPWSCCATVGCHPKAQQYSCSPCWHTSHLLCFTGGTFWQYKCIAMFWFEEGYLYSAVLCSPFGNSDGYEEHINMVKHASEAAGVPHEWTQVILFGGINPNH